MVITSQRKDYTLNHNPHCTGCTKCHPEMRAALSAFTKGDYATYCRWLTAQDAKHGIRTAAARGELRTNIRYEEDDMKKTRSRRLLQTVDGVMGPGFRAAVGKRHSAEDQGHLDAAAGHLAKAGSNAPGDIEEESPKLSVNASYKEKLSREFATLRAATRALEARAVARVPRMRTLESPDEVPNPWAIRAAAEVAECLDPHVWPGYDPYGAPPNGHAIALGLQQLQRAAREGRAPAATAPTTMLRDANGVPDGYKTALSRRSR